MEGVGKLCPWCITKSFGSMGAGGAGPERALITVIVIVNMVIKFVIMVSVSFGGCIGVSAAV